MSSRFVIDRLGAQGDGIAAGEGGEVFIPFTLPGETVTAARLKDRADLIAVLDPSPLRIDPACRHFGACGGCALQHWQDRPYLAWKADQVRIALRHERIETEIMPTFASAPATRRRLALHARRGKGGAVIGFKARRSWDLVPIAVCPISDPRLVAAFPGLRALAAPFLEHPKSAPSLHVTLTGTGIDVDVTGVERKSGGLSADARMRAAAVAQEWDFARVTLAGETVYQARAPLVKFGPAIVSLPAGGFLQAVPSAEREMARIAVEAAQGASRIADLYCGAGTFTFRLAQAAPVLAADFAAPAIAALKAAIATAPGLKAITAEARDLVRRPVLAGELKKTDVIVFDPPRAGALEQAAEIARSGASRVVGVSCNPATFARDAGRLIDAGFRLERVHPIDQFLWSPHVELVGVFGR
jgi:23S rRNA (uracil1939-C5)-methyltransferase